MRRLPGTKLVTDAKYGGALAVYTGWSFSTLPATNSPLTGVVNQSPLNTITVFGTNVSTPTGRALAVEFTYDYVINTCPPPLFNPPPPVSSPPPSPRRGAPSCACPPPRRGLSKAQRGCRPCAAHSEVGH